jgi:DNA phosphorothioation-dependent restriction protein DptG
MFFLICQKDGRVPRDSYSDFEPILYLAMSLINEQASASGSEKSKEPVFEDNDESESFEEGSENELVDDGPNEDENELSQAAVEEYKAAQERTGVIYISRIPPGMNPNKVRHLLSAYGEIGRVYLQQEGVLLLLFS